MNKSHQTSAAVEAIENDESAREQQDEATMEVICLLDDKGMSERQLLLGLLEACLDQANGVEAGSFWGKKYSKKIRALELALKSFED
jgi:hypothetical protein